MEKTGMMCIYRHALVGVLKGTHIYVLMFMSL